MSFRWSSKTRRRLPASCRKTWASNQVSRCSTLPHWARSSNRRSPSSQPNQNAPSAKTTNVMAATVTAMNEATVVAETAETETEAARAVVRATAAVVPAKAEVLTVTAAETELAPAATNAAVALPNETGANAAPTENVRSLAEAKTIGTQRATTRTRNVRLVQQPVTAMTVETATTSPKIVRQVVVTRRRRRAATQRAVTPTRTPPRTRANAVTLVLVNWVEGGWAP